MDINRESTKSGRFYAGSKDTHIMYNSHLQIVANREHHEQLKRTQMIVYPTSIIVTPAVLQMYHDKKFIDYMDQIKQTSPNAIWYILPAGTHGAENGYHCNGIRYGTKQGDYVSLVRIKSITGE